MLDLGCGDGRDTRWLEAAGLVATGVDVSEVAIRAAWAKVSPNNRTRSVAAEYLAYDALQLPAPLQRIDLIWDNTVYCNLRFEYLAQVLRMLDRITTPGHTLMLVNCGNADAPELVQGHPRLRRESLLAELGLIFDVVYVQTGVYDMRFTGPREEWA